MPRHWSASSAFAVLLVCTGNICRSAMAERLGRSVLDELLGEDAGVIQLSSAGTRAVVDSAMHPHSALVLQGFGGRPEEFRARQLHEAHAIDADLILTMTRAHRRAVLHEAPRALSRTFTLREAADVLGSLAEDLEVSGDSFGERARELVKEMAAARSQRQSAADDDVPDPIDGPIDLHQEVGDAIAEALVSVLGRFAALRSAGASGEPGRPGDAA